MSSLLEEDVCDDVFWTHVLPLLNLKDYVALASTSKTMRRRCMWIPDTRPAGLHNTATRFVPANGTGVSQGTRRNYRNCPH